MRFADVRSNSLTSSWSAEGSSDGFYQALMYTGIDLGVELFVFLVTVFVLKRMFPKLSARNILCGLLRTNSSNMILTTFLIWLNFLAFQSYYFGMDTTFRFE